MNKKIPLWLALLFLWCSFIITLLFAWAVWHIKSNGHLFTGKSARIIISLASLPSLAKESFREIYQPTPLIKPNVYTDIRGFKPEKMYIDSNYLLLPIYSKKENQTVVKLIRLYDQKIIYQWTPNYNEIKNSMGGKNLFWNQTDIHDKLLVHPLLSSDGSIIFHNALSPLIKINKYSKLIWDVNRSFHHSLEYDADGNIWSLSQIVHQNYLPNISNVYWDNVLTEISPSGSVLYQKSVTDLLIENGYRGLLFGTGVFDVDLLHVNDVQPALTTTKYWQKGDLLISVRNKSTVLLYRPSTNKIVWLKTGPWLNQHDVDFIDSTSIAVFGNNTVRMNSGDDRLIDGHNEEYILNFKTGETETPYTKFLKNAKVSTLTEGRSDVLPNGDLFIEETNNNRLLMGNKREILWQYVNRLDKHWVGALQWTRFITKEEFKKLTFLQHTEN